MKKKNNFNITFRTFLRNLIRSIDKLLVTPLTKLFVLITDKFGNNGRKLEKLFVKKSSLVIISLVLSLFAFFVVDSRSNLLVETSTEILYNQPVKAQYNEEAYVIEGLPKAVDITLIGRSSDLYLAKQLPRDSVIVDLSDLKPGTHKITLKYQKVISTINYKIDPSTTTVIIYPKVSVSKTVSVDTLNMDSLDKKLIVKNVSVDRGEVIIKGAEQNLKKVAIVKALVDANNIVNPGIGDSTLKDVPLIAYDKDGKVIDVEIVPSRVNATISLISPSKEVPIRIVPTGNLAIGKSISTITTDVTKVTIYGSESTLEGINTIDVEVNVEGLNQNKDFTLNIKNPVGIRFVSASALTAKIKLGESSSKDIADIRVDTRGLDSKYKVQAASIGDTAVAVVVKGVEDVLNNIDVTTIKAYVDLNGYGVGEHEVEVIVTGEDNRLTYTSKTKKIKVVIQNR